MHASPSSPAPGRARRRTARLHAVQALFQRNAQGTPLPRLLTEFHDHRLGAPQEDLEFGEADAAFFDDVVSGTAARETEIDAVITPRLASGWTLARLDPLMLQMLRAGTFELLARPDVPTSVILSEYAAIAHAFYPPAEAGFVNAVLDRLAGSLRSGEGAR
jgi:N utilization substance protein B